MNPFGNFLYPTKSLKPMEEMLLQELMYLAIVAKLSTTLMKMLSPVETCILKLWRKASRYSITVYVSSENAISMQATDISFERGRHEPYTIIS